MIADVPHRRLDPLPDRARCRRRRARASIRQTIASAAGVEQHALRFQPVAAGASGLLLVVLDRLRHPGVQDEADVRAIDAHAEGDGGDDEVALLRRELSPAPRAAPRASSPA